MKKYLMLALPFIFSLSLMLNAQNQGERTQGRTPLTVKERVERLATQLDLNKDQKVQVEALYEKQDKERATMREQAQASGQSREGMREKYEERRKAENADLEKIIGKEKMEKYLKLQEEMRQQRQQRQGATQN